MNQPLIAAVWYTNVRKLRKILRVVILCLFICLCCCHPHQIQSPAALTRLETAHKIRLSLLTPPTGFTCTILKTSSPSTMPVFIPYNQFVGHFVKQILLVFQSCLVTLCRRLHNPLPISFPLPFFATSKAFSYFLPFIVLFRLLQGCSFTLGYQLRVCQPSEL